MIEQEESLGGRLKGYEADYETRVDAKDYIVVRIDGHKFSKYTVGCKKPFDKILSQAMEETTRDLTDKFGAVTGYTQSDEITLIFTPQFSEKLVPIKYNEVDVFYDTNVYKIFDREDNYLGYLDTHFTDDEEGYCITDYYVVAGDNRIIDKCSLQGRNPQTVEKTEAMFSKYLIKKVVVTNEQIFGGRVQKMVSLISAYTTMQFNKRIGEALVIAMDEFDYTVSSEYLKTEEEYWLRMRKKVGEAWFDARIYGVESPEEAYNSLMWRVRDAEKNSRSMFAQSYCSHKSLLNKTGVEQVEFCLEQTGNDWEQSEERYKYGILVKKEQYEKDVTSQHPNAMKSKVAIRTRMVSFVSKLTNFSEENVDLIMSRLK